MPEALARRAAPTGVELSVRALWPPAVLLGAVVLFLVNDQGARLQLLYPVAAVAVAMRLLMLDSVHYVSFVIWLWTVTPLVRRLADFQGGWHDPSPILLTPYLATILSIAPVLAGAATAPISDAGPPRGRSRVFTLALLGIAAGIPLGFAFAPPRATVELLNWLVPIAFGSYVSSCVDRRSAIEEAVVKTCGRVMLGAGAYGVFQFLRLPPWDADWMVSSEMASIGQAEPFAVRVFSTMHSPGVLGLFLLVPLVAWLAQPRAAGLMAACLGSVTLLLSQVRTAWFGVAAGLVLVLASVAPLVRVRVVLLAGIVAVGAAPLVMVPDVAEITSARVETLAQADEDVSAISRLEGYASALAFVGHYPFGGGLGFSNDAEPQTIGARDSVFTASLVQFGILGAAIYAVSLCLLAGCLWTYYRRAEGPYALGLSCAGLGLICTAGFGAVTAGPPGVMLWLIGGLAIADQRRGRSQERNGRC